MIMVLNDMFQTQARTERFNVSKAFAETKLAEGIAVGPHVIRMVGYTQRLEKLGFPIGQELATDFILASILPSYGNFVSNYHMHGAEKGLNELCGMLKIVEADIKNGAGSSHVMAVQTSLGLRRGAILGRRKRARLKMRSLSQTHLRPRLDQLLVMSAFIVRRKVTGKGTTSYTWNP
jgi:hypothetical protein